MAPKRKKAEPKETPLENDSFEKSESPETKKLKQEDYSSNAKTDDGELWNHKIVSWNVDGVRAWLKKDGVSYFTKEEPDIICLQEIKCSEDKLPSEIKNLKGYSSHFCCAKKEGYSGVALFSKVKPLSISYEINDAQHDDEGRLITAEFENFYVVTAYVPNAGRKLVTLDKRMDWDPKLKAHLKELDAKKPVIYCGDLNVAHQEIDLTNPKTNKRNAGFTKEERDGFTDLLSSGFIDSFRHLYPDKKGQYTFWTYMMNCRAKNVGWRLDYFVLSERLKSNLCDSIIRSTIMGSDHCPIALLFNI